MHFKVSFSLSALVLASFISSIIHIHNVECFSPSIPLITSTSSISSTVLTYKHQTQKQSFSKPQEENETCSSPKTTTTTQEQEPLVNLAVQVTKTFAFLCIMAFTTASPTLLSFPQNAYADEFGKEVEAPTLFTGESVMICTKRGPLGACLQTTQRTNDNDNDKAKKYFTDPEIALKAKYTAAQLQSIKDNNDIINNNNDNGMDTTTSESSSSSNSKDDVSEGSALIQKLKQQSLDNKEKNDLIIRQKTLQNDLGASFGPLDRQVVILNSDGESYTLLDGAQAMRLKKAGYIKDKRFVTQPTQEVIDEAGIVPEDGKNPVAFLGGIVKNVLGGDGGSGGGGESSSE